MRFLGGFLQFFSFLLMIADTIGCVALIIVDEITADDPELLVVVAVMWLVGLIISLCVLGTGIALTQIAKLKKRVRQLEDRTMALVYGAPVAPVAAPATVPVAAPAAPMAAPAAEKAYTEEAPASAPAVQEAPVPAAVQPAAESTAAQPIYKKKWFPAVIAAAVVVVVVVVVLIAGGRDDSAMDMPQQDALQAEDSQLADMAPQQEQEEQVAAPVENTIPVQFGESIDHADFSMTIDRLELLDEFSYDTSDYSSTSLYVEPGYKLLAVFGHFANLGTSTISESAFARTALINGEYLVDGYDVRMNFLRSNSFEIDPYTDMDYVIYVNIPDKLAEQFQTVTFTFGFNEDLSVPVTVWDMEGNSTVEVDKTYSFIGDLNGSAAAQEAAGEAPATGAVQETESNALITLGETVYTSDYEFTLKNVELTYEALPPNTSSVYSSYTAESGKVFVHVEADVKNTMQRDIRIDELFTASALYDGAYPYDGFTVVNDDNRFDWVSNYVAATPLETVGAHSIIECPVEVDTSGNSIIVILEIGGEKYDYILR